MGPPIQEQARRGSSRTMEWLSSPVQSDSSVVAPEACSLLHSTDGDIAPQPEPQRPGVHKSNKMRTTANGTLSEPTLPNSPRRPESPTSSQPRRISQAAAFTLALIGAGMIVSWAYGPSLARAASQGVRSTQLFKSSHVSEDECRTAAPGDECYQNIEWHKEDFEEHPQWYAGLTKGSSVREWQRWTHEQGKSTCPLPCDVEEDVDAPSRGEAPAVAGEEKEGKDLDGQDDCAEIAQWRGKCHTSVAGESCFASVDWAMKVGLPAHPDWYKGITEDSPFEKVQAFLHDHHFKLSCCPRPCGDEDAEEPSEAEEPIDAEDAEEPSEAEENGSEGGRGCALVAKGDPCYKAVDWAMNVGIVQHPEWYKSGGKKLSGNSTFKEFQQFLHDERKMCPAPCNHKGHKSGSELASSGAGAAKTTSGGNTRVGGSTSSRKSARATSRPSKPTTTSSSAAAHTTARGLRGSEGKSSSSSEHGAQATSSTSATTSSVASSSARATTSTVASTTRKGSTTAAGHAAHGTSTSAPAKSSGASSSARTTTGRDGSSTTRSVATTTHAAASSAGDDCSTAVKGDKCYNSVVWAMGNGMEKHADWYPGVNASSAFEDFQRVLHAKYPAMSGCPKPCGSSSAPSLATPATADADKAVGTETPFAAVEREAREVDEDEQALEAAYEDDMLPRRRGLSSGSSDPDLAPARSAEDAAAIAIAEGAVAKTATKLGSDSGAGKGAANFSQQLAKQVKAEAAMLKAASV